MWTERRWIEKNKESFRQHNAGDRKQHTPIYEKHFTYVIAALRVLANKLEEKTNGEWESAIKGAEKLMNTIDVIQKEEEVQICKKNY